MYGVKEFIEKKGVRINGKVCYNMARKLSTGDLISFHKGFKVKERFSFIVGATISTHKEGKRFSVTLA